MYLDPGFGGMLVQGLFVLAAVSGAVLFSLRRRIWQIFSKDRANTVPFDNHTANEVDDDALDILGD